MLIPSLWGRGPFLTTWDCHLCIDIDRAFGPEQWAETGGELASRCSNKLLASKQVFDFGRECHLCHWPVRFFPPEHECFDHNFFQPGSEFYLVFLGPNQGTCCDPKRKHVYASPRTGQDARTCFCFFLRDVWKRSHVVLANVDFTGLFSRCV